MKAEDVMKTGSKEDRILRIAFTSPDGDDALRVLKERYNGRNGGTDAISIARAEGRRDVVLDILEAIESRRDEL